MNTQKIYLKKRSHKGHGLGADLCVVLSALHFYEFGICSGIEVDHKDTGNYYDPRYGQNWWDYYFEPLRLGSQDGAKIIDHHWFMNGQIAFYQESKEENHQLIQKYIRVKKEILDQVNAFTEKHFKDHFVVGLAYRGTDKRCGTECDILSYEIVLNRFKEILRNQSVNLEDCLVYICTDESDFLKYMASHLPKIVYVEETKRSEDLKCLHEYTTDPYQTGREALIDSLILSKTNLIVRTHSSLYSLSTFFNPVPNDFLINTPLYVTSEERREKYRKLKEKIKKGHIPYELLNEVFD